MKIDRTRIWGRRRLLSFGGLAAVAGLSPPAPGVSAQSGGTAMQTGAVNNGGAGASESSTNITSTTALVANTSGTNPALRVRQLGGDRSVAVEAVGGSLAVGSTTTTPRIVIPTPDAAWRIMRYSGNDPTGQRDHILAFTYNIDTTVGTPVGGLASPTQTAPDVASEPGYLMGFESRWNSAAEWNWDLQPEGNNTTKYRCFGVDFSYTTRISTWEFAWQTGGGFRMFGGPGTGTVALRTSTGQRDAALRIQRQDSSTFFKVHPGLGSIVMTSHPTKDINPAGWNGTIRMLDTALAFDIGGTTPNDIAFAARIVKGGEQEDPQFRFVARTEGKLEWGSGAAVRDTNLYRSAAGVLKTDGALTVGGALRHSGSQLGFYNVPPVARPSVTGSRGGNLALADLLQRLELLGLITNATTA